MKRILDAVTNQSRVHARSELHLLRKLWHAGGGLFLVLLYTTVLSKGAMVTFLGISLTAVMMGEALRLHHKGFNRFLIKIFQPLIRKNEMKKLSAVPAYVLGALLCIGVFPKPVAALSILYLAFGDPMASTFGVLYGERSLRLANGKTLIGTVAGILVCVLVTVIFLASYQIPFGTLLLISLIGGTAGGLAEHVPGEVDDNLLIPVISGFVLWLTFIFFGI